MIRQYDEKDLNDMIIIWNEVVKGKKAFPQIECLTFDEAKDFFKSQTFAGVYESDGKVTGLYILHPNSIGRCGHIANASYAVKEEYKGQKIGEQLVQHSLDKAKEKGFKIMQFNAVVQTNERALKLYKKIGFEQLGIIKNGFKVNENEYLNIIPHVYYL